MAGYLGNTQKISGRYTVDEFTSSGGTTYTLTKTPGAKNNIQVSAGGLVQYPSAYSVSGTTLTLSGVPSGQKVVVRHMGDTIPYPLLADDAVTTAKIAAASVTTAKLVAADVTSFSAYDIGFTAGFDKDMVKENVAVATYGELVMARAGTFLGESGYVDTAPTGAILIVDVLKNGTTIYSTKPQFAISATALTAGVLSVTSFAAADRITFKVTQIGSTEAGEGVRFTLKGKL